MLRLGRRTYRQLRFLHSKRFCSSSISSSTSQYQIPNELSKDSKNSQKLQSPIVRVNTRTLSPLFTASPSRTFLLALSSTVISAVVASYLILSADPSNGGLDSKPDQQKRLFYTIEHAIERSNESAKRIIDRMKQTGVAASVLWQSLRSVLSSANYEVRSGFESRVASFLADIAAVNGSRRAAIVAAGGGKVVDWLLETVSAAGDGSGTQAEAARALAYLIADPVVREEVFGRPGAVPRLLRFIFASQPPRSKKNSRRSSFDVSDSLKGRSMLVAAIMDVVTSNCKSLDDISFRSSLPEKAEMRDIAAAIEVIEGGMNLDDPVANEDDDDGGNGLKGIGMKVLGETTIVGLSRSGGLMKYADVGDVEYGKYIPKNLLHQIRLDSFLPEANLSSAVVPGLWDDLHSQHIAVPFAAWALANWAMASETNRIHIQELDRDGHAVMTALAAPERSVKWHGSLVARLLLEDKDLPLYDSVSEWSFNLLITISQACKTEDIPLAQVALSAFLLSVERSPGAKKVVMEKGLPVMRETAKHTTKHMNIQEALAMALELICTGEIHLSLDESQKWSSILLSWVCGEFPSEKTRSSATKILSHILEDYGPLSVPISQGWLTILLSEILEAAKPASMKGSTRPKSAKVMEVKTQINQSNISSTAQIVNQLATAVVNLAGNQLGTVDDSADTFPLKDLLSQEPFAGPFKSSNKDRYSKFHVADSAVASLKGIKALAEICSDDPLYQNKLADSGVLCLVRRYLLRDDYEKLAAIEAYNASRARETHENTSNAPNESIPMNDKDHSSVQFTPTSHIRRHAARLLTILSALPKAQKVIKADEIWCKWLEECANGKIPGCNDPKTRSYARATLLNVLCNGKGDSDFNSGGSSNDEIPTVSCYDDMIFIINPESTHWKCPDTVDSETFKKNTVATDEPYYVERSGADEGKSVGEGEVSTTKSNADDATNVTMGYDSCLQAKVPPLDIIFVHGLRGGPFNTWRLSDNKSSTTSGLVEKIDQEAGKQDTFWPGEWLSADFPHARIFTLKYKTSLTQWSGASLPLQEVSLMLLKKLVAAGIGKRPVVFVAHSMGGLVVKQMLYEANTENLTDFVNNTVGVVFYSCPHFGTKLADVPWRMGLVLRPAPTVEELRSGSPRLVELNDFMRRLNKRGLLDVLSFCETKVTPIVKGYGGWAIRMEIVPIDSAYPGFGDLVVLESTDHINSCKPLSRDDPAYVDLLNFLRKLNP
ncbi:hypothetical protein Nepgr_025069 [Nepenthes gracilis]|uniref:GPI inositol-deacylase n=1 Tax=Nepenthes gracilis TaxID=150966 RepID=A0AAD3T732_NEPGR|nr:hypothetical protein Nepgr_025069 [Nepenthes gracilis]